MQIEFLDTTEQIVHFLDSLHDSISNSIAVDLEGVNLGRSGRACIIQLFPDSSDTVYLVDLTVLGIKAFEVTNTDGQSLRKVFEGEIFRKVFWDVRNDSDALYYHYGLNLSNCFDLQVLEVALRRSSGKQSDYVSGLARAMKTYGVSDAGWLSVKERGIELFDPTLGGSCEVFEARPLASAILEYCAHDVILLFDLEKALKRRLGRKKEAMEKVVVRETKRRVEGSKDEDYNGTGQHMTLANISWS